MWNRLWKFTQNNGLKFPCGEYYCRYYLWSRRQEQVQNQRNISQVLFSFAKFYYILAVTITQITQCDAIQYKVGQELSWDDTTI